MTMRHIAIIGILPLLLIGTVTATAHALLDHATPLVGSSVPTPPREVALTFTQNLEASFSIMSVTNASGQRIDAGRVSVSGNMMRVPLRSIGPGTYQVHWRVLSVDTHTTSGNFSFRVGQ
jgi:methionine-rich copper-binding protein CopC